MKLERFGCLRARFQASRTSCSDRSAWICASQSSFRRASRCWRIPNVYRSIAHSIRGSCWRGICFRRLNFPGQRRKAYPARLRLLNPLTTTLSARAFADESWSRGRDAEIPSTATVSRAFAHRGDPDSCGGFLCIVFKRQAKRATRHPLKVSRSIESARHTSRARSLTAMVCTPFTDAHLNIDPQTSGGAKTNKMFVLPQVGNHDARCTTAISSRICSRPRAVRRLVLMAWQPRDGQRDSTWPVRGCPRRKGTPKAHAHAGQGGNHDWIASR